MTRTLRIYDGSTLLKEFDVTGMSGPELAEFARYIEATAPEHIHITVPDDDEEVAA